MRNALALVLLSWFLLPSLSGCDPCVARCSENGRFVRECGDWVEEYAGTLTCWGFADAYNDDGTNIPEAEVEYHECEDAADAIATCRAKLEARYLLEGESGPFEGCREPHAMSEALDAGDCAAAWPHFLEW